MRRYLTPESLTKILTDELVEEQAAPVHHKLFGLLDKVRKGKDEDSHEEE